MSSARRFTLIDSMVLVAATAVGIGLAKGYWTDLLFFLAHNGFIHSPFKSRPGIAASATLRVIALSLPGGMAWTLSVLALRLRRPRPSWRRLSIQPGLVASLVALLPLGIKLVECTISYILEFHTNLITPARLPSPPFIEVGSPPGMGTPPSLPEFWSIVFTTAPTSIGPCIGMCVAGAWMVLALSGRCRPERSWIDRLGRVLGVYWIAVATLVSPLSEFARYLQ